LFYVTGHGFGHAVRAAQVMAELVGAHGRRVTVRTSAPAWLFGATGAAVEPAVVDAGVAQKDALTTDLPATVAYWERLMTTFPEALAVEARAIDRIDPDVVVVDIAPLGVAAGVMTGRPTFVIANFLWDAILAGYAAEAPGLTDVAAKLTQVYATATALLRTPLNVGMEGYANVVDIPLIARRSSLTKNEARTALGIGGEEPVALISLGGGGLARFLDRIDRRITRCRLLTFGDEPAARGRLTILPRSVSHVDAVMAADVVVGKLGYGLCAELIAARRGVLYTPRADFVEYDSLARGLARQVPVYEAGPEEFYAGALDEPVARLIAAGEGDAPSMPTDGARVAARLIDQRIA
jgi:L-arabinokinase